MPIRPAALLDHEAIWAILEPVLREGTTYALPRDFSKDEALAYWFTPGHHVWICEEDGAVLGTYYLRPNQRGGGAHVANCGYMTAHAARSRGVASAMCAHSLETARALGFSAMQFNFVVSTNEGAIRLWRKHGFATAGTLPQAFHHPAKGFVDAFIMYRSL